METDPLAPIEEAMKAIDDNARRYRGNIDHEDARAEAYKALLGLLDGERERSQYAIAAAVAAEREQWEYALRAALAGMRGLEELMHRA